MYDNLITEELEAQIKQKIEAKELEVQTILAQARERYAIELRASMEYHQNLAETLAREGEPSRALRHVILVDIYRSLLERA